MSTIVDYKIETDKPEDDTFETTKTVIQKTITVTTARTDEFGNIISARHQEAPSVKTTKEETLSAIGSISKSPARVVILETDRGLTKEGIEREKSDGDRKNITLRN